MSTVETNPDSQSPTIRLTGYAHGGGCACKIPPGELEDAHLAVAVPDRGDAGRIRRLHCKTNSIRL